MFSNFELWHLWILFFLLLCTVGVTPGRKFCHGKTDVGLKLISFLELSSVSREISFLFLKSVYFFFIVVIA